MTVKGNTGAGGVSYNDLLKQNHRLQDQIKELRKTISDLVDELEQERLGWRIELGEAVPPRWRYRCCGKPTTTDDVGRVVPHVPACGWKGARPRGAATFCPQCGGWLVAA